MPLSWNTVNTHSAGDVLPLADWNQAATSLNSMVGTWISTGTISNTAINATPPFFAWAASISVTTSTLGTVNVPIPNGGFPNGVICVPSSLAQPPGVAANSYNIYPTQGSTKTTLQFQCVNTTNGAGLNTVALEITFLAIGY